MEWKTFLFTFLIDVPHINELVLELVHRPDLTALAAVLDEDRRLTHKATPLSHSHSTDYDNVNLYIARLCASACCNQTSL